MYHDGYKVYDQIWYHSSRGPVPNAADGCYSAAQYYEDQEKRYAIWNNKLLLIYEIFNGSLAWKT